MTAVIVEVKKEDDGESSLNLLKRFNRRLQMAGVLRRAKTLQHATRTLSHYKKKKNTLKRLAKREKIERLRKLGKLPDARYKKYY